MLNPKVSVGARFLHNWIHNVYNFFTDYGFKVMEAYFIYSLFGNSNRKKKKTEL